MKCARAAYYGMINFIDDQIGRLIQYCWWDSGTASSSFTSDHGEMLGDHNLYRKTWPYEASATSAFSYAGTGESGATRKRSVCQSPVGLQDIMPTILDAVGRRNS